MTDLGRRRRREQARASSQWKEPLWVPILTAAPLILANRTVTT